jgi:Amt family ammonium transporter
MRLSSFSAVVIRPAALLALAALGGADEVPAAPKIDTGDTAWMLVATGLVLFMTIPGLSLLYAGLVRAKNALSIFMQCFAITSWVTVLWVTYGYSLAFSTAGMSKGVLNVHSFIGGFDRLFLAGVSATSVHPMAATIPESVFLCFQLTFAIITPALIISSFAERVKFSAVMVFTTIWLTLVYLPVCHMDWSGPGSLFGDHFGIYDLAGGCVVEINSGVSGLIAAIIVGKRLGYPHTPMLPHSIALALVGGGMLWVGWFGFNAGSATSAGTAAGMALLTTHIASAVAACTWMAIEWIRFGKPSALGIVTGSLAGLVAITPACGSVGPMGAIALGIVATGCCYIAISWLKRRFGYDDTLDVFGVHGVAGVVGTILLGVFCAKSLGGQTDAAIGPQLLAQVEAVAVTIAWAVVGTLVSIKLVDWTIGLRVPTSVEAAGIDLDQHNEVAYSIEERV